CEGEVVMRSVGGGEIGNGGGVTAGESSNKDWAPAQFDLVVGDGRFTLINRSVNPPVERNYTGVNVELDDFSPRQSFGFMIGLTIPGEKAGKVEVEGQAGPIDSQDESRTPIDARVR